MALNANALTTVNDLLSYIGESVPSQELLSIYHDQSAGATAATIGISAGTLTLIVTGGTNAGTETITLSSHATVTALVAAINALSKGWVASVEGGNANADPSVLDDLATVSAYGIAAVQYPAGRNTYAYEQAINAASSKIEHYCSRVFAATDYSHMYSGHNHKSLPLRQAPIIRVDRVSIGRQEAFRVRNTGTDNAMAQMALTATEGRFEIVGGAGHGSTTVAYTSSTTLTSFVASINALGSNWEAEVLTTADGSWRVTDCFQFAARNTATRWLTIWIPFENQDRYEVHSEAGVIYRTGWGLSLSPLAWPSGSWWHWAGKPLELRPLNAEAAGPYWPDGVFNIYVKYRAGYETIPDDVKYACNELAKNIIMNAPRNTALTGETVPGYTWTAGFSGPLGRSGGEGAFSQNIRQLLAIYRRYINPEFVEV